MSDRVGTNGPPAVARLALTALALLVLAAAAAVAARADGDPASDYLLADSTFLSPFDGHVDPAESARLVQMVAEAQQKGLPLKVAVIVTPYDLGSVPILFDKPQTYAKFLSEEDYYYWKNLLLVVMPDGYGVYRSTGTTASDLETIRKVRFTDSKSGTELVVEAQKAVRALAASHGIELSAAAGSTSHSSLSANGRERIEIAVAVAAVLLAAVGVRFGRRRLARR